MSTDPYSLDLFPDSCLSIGTQAVLLEGFALDFVPLLIAEIKHITRFAPYRKMLTPNGARMSVGLSNCGALGWVSDQTGYRYVSRNPSTSQPWPAMPTVFCELSRLAAAQAGFCDFIPDACLINHYVPGAQMGLHQDKNERDFQAPIVSVSLGLPAVFLWGGLERSAPISRFILRHGDVLVWGGEDRLRFHGVAPIAAGKHPILGEQRINLTFRQAR